MESEYAGHLTEYLSNLIVTIDYRPLLLLLAQFLRHYVQHRQLSLQQAALFQSLITTLTQAATPTSNESDAAPPSSDGVA
jgi:hypothetical protein